VGDSVLRFPIGRNTVTTILINQIKEGQVQRMNELKDTKKTDRRKADYTDRPLNEIEKAFAADPKNYNEFLRYMKVRKLDPEEWYDILIFCYLRTVKKYLSFSELQKHPFVAILFTTLDHRRLDHFRDMNREKRRPENGIVSLDWEVENMDEKGKKTAPISWIDYKESVEKIVLYREMIKEIVSALDDIQKEIFKRLIEEYGKEETRIELEIGSKTYRRHIKEIKKVVVDYLSM